MLIAYVTETWPPEINGVANSAFRTVSFLRQRRHEVQVVRPSQGADDAEPDGLLVPGIPLVLYRDLQIGLPVRRRLVKRWALERPDVVHVATEGPLGWAAVSAATRLGIAITSDYRTRFDTYTQYYAPRWATRLVSRYLRRFHNRCATTFVPTAEMRAVLIDDGVENVFVSARGVDCERFSPSKRSGELRNQWKADGPVLLYVGRLAREKNLGLIAPAFEAALKACPSTKLVIVGDGPERSRLEQSCPGAIFAGTQTKEALAACYASADVFLFPSVTETFGNVTLEAMASALSVVAFKTAAAGVHIVSGQNGLTVAPGDDAGFVEAVAALVANAELMSSMRQSARATALKVDWNSVLSEFETRLAAMARKGEVREHAVLARS